MRRTNPHFIRSFSILAAAALLGGCASSGGAGGSGAHHRSRTGGTDTTQLDLDCDQMQAELLRVREERDRLAQTNTVLEDELRWAHDDLTLVERQFSEFEHRLSEDFGKAAAVSATAEARIHLDRVRASVSLPDTTIQHVTALLGTAEQLIRSNNYPAAFFFAERANHTLQGAERRISLRIETTELTVKVATANVREGPGQEYPVLATVAQGERVSCIHVARNWCHVVTTDGATGWIHASLLR